MQSHLAIELNKNEIRNKIIYDLIHHFAKFSKYKKIQILVQCNIFVSKHIILKE
jgi:hypothetical protein